jgi:hypothetical protein
MRWLRITTSLRCKIAEHNRTGLREAGHLAVTIVAIKGK